MENKGEKKHSGSAFLWGFILGAIFATLLTTKKGRAILRELVNTGMEMIEDFVEEKKTKAYEKKLDEKEKIIIQEDEEDIKQTAADLETEIEAEEEEDIEGMNMEEVMPDKMDVDDVSEEALKFAKKMENEAADRPEVVSSPRFDPLRQSVREVSQPKKRGSKRRLFRGIRKSKAN